MTRRRLAGFGLSLAVAVAAAGGCGSAASMSATVPAGAAATHVPDGDWTRFDYNAQRSGVGPADTGITSRNVRGLGRRQIHIDGTVDASAIQLHDIRVRGRARDVAIVTTTYGRTIAFDPGTGAKLWEFVPGDIGRYEGSYRITDATPVADPDRRWVYAASPDGRIHKLSVSTGQEVRSGRWPMKVTLDSTHEKLAAALNLNGRWLIATTGGYIGDAPPYQGHVLEIDRTTGAIHHIWNALCSNRYHLLTPSSCPASDAAIWARSGAVVEPGTGRIYVATGNAPFNGSTDWGVSVLELSPTLSLLSNWTPVNESEHNTNDTDVGSTAPALLPPVGGQRLAVQGGKDEHLYLLDLGRLNGANGRASGRKGGSLQRIPAPGPAEVLTAPVVWSHNGRSYVFVATDGGTAAYVLGGDRRLHTLWQHSTAGTSPVLAGGLLYVYDEVDGVLIVRNPLSGIQLASLPASQGHWNSPIAVGGRVILPEGNANDHATSGTIDVYHLPGR
jgi:hypothetical protein